MSGFPTILSIFAVALPVVAQTPPVVSFLNQDYQPAQKCLPCHQRQYDELRSAVKAGYRNVSPLFNSLEMSANFLNGGLLRPVYSDSTKLLPDGTPLTTNMFTTPMFSSIRQVQSGFCVTCHNPHVERAGDDPNKREVPELGGVGADFQPEAIRPLRDYHLVDAYGKQVLPADVGGEPPAGAQPSLGASGITCDVCHNVAGPDLNRSFQHDAFANTSLLFNHSMEKVGPFPFPVAPKGNFHVPSNDQSKIDLLRSSAFCNACHDVRVPLAGEGPGNLQAEEHDMNPGGDAVTYFRLENLSTEWQTGAYNSTANPFGKVVRCQDCHMSLFPFGGDSTYQAGGMKVTSPTPGVFAQNYAAVPGISTDGDFPLSKRKVVTHYFTGVDVPILYADELQARLGGDYPDPYTPGDDEYRIPKSIAARREALMKAAVRINLDKTDATARLGEEFSVRAECVALTGHRFPAGFSQERTTYIQLSVTDDNGVTLYQSGYVVDKPHPDTGENAPDGNLHDEDLEHVHAVVDPGRHIDRAPGDPYQTGPAGNGHTNQVFEAGPDDGPDGRVYFGINEGLVLFRNELTRVYLPGQSLGRSDANGNPIVATKPHYEETFSAAFANTVDNYRSLRPLAPRTFRYDIRLPSADELKEMGIDSIQGPLHVHAQVNYEHFPPLFVRFLARTTSAGGPSGHDMHMLSEQRLDDLVKNVPAIATADFTVEVEQ
jgi:hypothetical protein